MSVGTENVAGEIANDETGGIAFDADIENSSTEADRVRIVNRLDFDGLGTRFGKNGPGCVFRKMTVGGDDDAEDVVAQGGNAQVRWARFDVDAVVLGVSSGDGGEGRGGLGDECDGQD